MNSKLYTSLFCSNQEQSHIYWGTFSSCRKWHDNMANLSKAISYSHNLS